MPDTPLKAPACGGKGVLHRWPDNQCLAMQWSRGDHRSSQIADPHSPCYKGQGDVSLYAAKPKLVTIAEVRLTWGACLTTKLPLHCPGVLVTVDLVTVTAVPASS